MAQQDVFSEIREALSANGFAIQLRKSGHYFARHPDGTTYTIPPRMAHRSYVLKRVMTIIRRTERERGRQWEL